MRSTVSQDHFAWFLLTCPDESFRDPQRALKLVKSVTATVPERLPAWRTLSLAHYRLGQWDDAETALQPLMVGRSDHSLDAATLYVQAMIEWQLGERDEARQTYERAVHYAARQQTLDRSLAVLSREASAILKK